MDEQEKCIFRTVNGTRSSLEGGGGLSEKSASTLPSHIWCSI